MRLQPMLLSLLICGALAQAADVGSPADHVETAHNEMWRRFVDEHGVVLDAVDVDGRYERPTAEECRAGKPNALGWLTPTENGAMFTGLYLDAACLRWQRTQAAADAEKVRRLARGLMFLSERSPVKGFIARNAATDGTTPYPMGSNDQTLPWFYGLWRYLESGLPTSEERRVIIARMVEVANVLEASRWRMPNDEGAPSPYRGTFAPFIWEGAPRLLFLLKVMHHLTGDAKWDRLYQESAWASGGKPARTRLEICRTGMTFSLEKGNRHSWTGSMGVISLRGLWELENDAELKGIYAEGLLASAREAAQSLPLHRQWNNDAVPPYLHDWRQLNLSWHPQQSEKDAATLAEEQIKSIGKLTPNSWKLGRDMREPIFAAMIITLCPDQSFVAEQRKAIETVLSHYRYDRMNRVEFFPVEATLYRLP